MLTYYCKNCNNLIGKWSDKYKCYCNLVYCYCINPKNNEFIYFLDCENCNKFIGIECYYVCKNCFGEKAIIGEKNLFNFFLKYKKRIKNKYFCTICNNNDFRYQYWFFEELIFYK